MYKRKLCPRCKTGKETYELDKNSPICPYIGMHDGIRCTMFVELEKPKKEGMLKKLLSAIL